MRRLNWGQLVAPTVYISVFTILAVFGHSGLQGEYGLVALHQAESLERELVIERERASARRARLENIVSRLRTDNLDLDLLDERARAVLGYVRPDELVIR